MNLPAYFISITSDVADKLTTHVLGGAASRSRHIHRQNLFDATEAMQISALAGRVRQRFPAPLSPPDIRRLRAAEALGVSAKLHLWFRGFPLRSARKTIPP